MSNYLRIKKQAQDNEFYMKIGGEMVFIDFWEVPAVVEMLDKMRQAFCSVSSQMKDIIKIVFFKESSN